MNKFIYALDAIGDLLKALARALEAINELL
jgi:hypothetical protein